MVLLLPPVVQPDKVRCQDTLDAAQNDAEHLVVDRLRKKAEYVEK